MTRTLDSGLEKEATGQVWGAPLCVSKLSWHFNKNIGIIQATGSRTAVENHPVIPPRLQFRMQFSVFVLSFLSLYL